MQLKEAQATVVDLKSQLDQAKAGLKLAQETSIISEQTISSTLCERANELEKVVKDMEQQIEELSRRSADILLRYQQANLVCSFQFAFSFRTLETDDNWNSHLQTDIEKNFVAYIMKQTRDIHEQDVVAKDNELRRASFFYLLIWVAISHNLWQRETMIQSLQAKIVDMEMTVARMIKEKENLRQVGPLAKSVVSLNRWLPASPVS